MIYSEPFNDWFKRQGLPEHRKVRWAEIWNSCLGGSFKQTELILSIIVDEVRENPGESPRH